MFPRYDVLNTTEINRGLSGREFGPAKFAIFVDIVNTDDHG
jgi:hypothetical protein